MKLKQLQSLHDLGIIIENNNLNKNLKSRRNKSNNFVYIKKYIPVHNSSRFIEDKNMTSFKKINLKYLNSSNCYERKNNGKMVLVYINPNSVQMDNYFMFYDNSQRPLLHGGKLNNNKSLKKRQKKRHRKQIKTRRNRYR